jgi:hypothetical protein
MNNNSDYLTPDMVAERLHLAKGTLANWRYRGEGPKYTKFGRKVRYLWSDLEDWAKSNEVRTVDQGRGDL